MDTLLEENIYVLGMYVIMAEMSDSRGRVKSNDWREIIEKARLSPADELTLDRALTRLWDMGLIVRHDVTYNHSGKSDRYWYMESQDRTRYKA